MITISTYSEELFSKGIRETLLNLDETEREERRRALRDFLFYEGHSKVINGIDYKDLDDEYLIGQEWKSNDNIDYIPTHEIRNKVKMLLKKQARFIFGVEPSLNFRPDDVVNKQQCNSLRRYVEDILEENSFWSKTRKAFLESTIKKRVALRVEINRGRPITIKYESIENCAYKEKDGRLMEIKFFEEDEQNAYKEKDTEKIYYLHVYYYDYIQASDGFYDRKAMYRKETYKNQKKIEEETIDTGFDVLPAWIIKNGDDLSSPFGESDLEDLKDAQIDYNKTVSDYRDALRFQMFGSLTAIDGDPTDVNRLKISPGAIHAIATMQNMGDNTKQAKLDKIEYSMSNADAIEKHLDRAENDMYFMLDMPRISQLVNIPSAKAITFLYNDLIARCKDKFGTWNKAFVEMFKYIIVAAQYCYRDFDKSWLKMNYTIDINLNFPLPSTVEDDKTIAMQEVKEKVRSHESYIEEFSLEEDYKTEWNSVLRETKQLTEAESDPFTAAVESSSDSEGGDIDG